MASSHKNHQTSTSPGAFFCPRTSEHAPSLKLHVCTIHPDDSQPVSRAISEHAHWRGWPANNKRPGQRPRLPPPLHLPLRPGRRIPVRPLRHPRPPRHARFRGRSPTECRPGAGSAVFLLRKVQRDRESKPMLRARARAEIASTKQKKQPPLAHRSRELQVMAGVTGSTRRHELSR
jgi:hypothetical protein